MNGSSLFSNKLTNVAMPCFTENSESCNLNDGKNSEVDCSLINTCSGEDEVSSNDMIFESKSGEVFDLKEKKKDNFDDIECQPSPNLSDEVDSSSSVIQSHNEQKSSPVSSDMTDNEVDSSNSVMQSHDEQKSSPVSSDMTDHEVDSSSSVIQNHDEQKSSLVSSDTIDQTQSANSCPLLTEELNSTDTSFHHNDHPKNCTSSATSSDPTSNIDLRKQQYFQTKQDKTESIDSLSFDDKLQEIRPTDLEKSQNVTVTTESTLLITENEFFLKNPKDNEGIVEECEDDTKVEQPKIISKDMRQENETESTDKDLFTEVDTIDSNSNSNDKVFHETLSCINSSKEDVPELMNASINSCTNQIVVLESVSLSNPETISSDISENISLFEVHGLQNSEDSSCSSSSKSEENTDLAKDVTPNSLGHQDGTPDYPTEVDELQNSEDSSTLKENTNLAKDERTISVTDECMKLDNPTSPSDLSNPTTEVLNNEAEGEMAWLSIEEFKDGLIETISTNTSETMFEASLIDTKEGIQCKEVHPLSCKDEKNISPYTRFGLKSCRVDLGDSRISHKLLKSMEDPFSNKPHFNKLKRKLEIMLISAQKEEDKAMKQLKKMRNEKSAVLQDILKEIQKIKKKFKV